MGFSFRETYITLVYLSFLYFGFTAPFVFALGYVWVDIFYPQALSDYLNLIPVAMIMGLAAIIGYFGKDRRDVHVSAQTVLTVMMAIWVTLTCTWAEVPYLTWTKWDWAFKTVLFSAFLPFVFRSRIQIESFIQVYMFASSAYMFPVAVKMLISGGGYGYRQGLTNNNYGLAESSALAGVCVAIIPLALFLRTHSLLLPRTKWRDFGYIGLAVLSLFGAIGTFARTALVAFAALGAHMLVASRRKMLVIILGSLAAAAVVYSASSAWDTRISTVDDYSQDESAMTRILMWKWTINYAATHPWGGGFTSYLISRIEYPAAPGEAPIIAGGRAFHSSYFEVLGEQGVPGAILFGSLILMSFKSIWAVRRKTKNVPHMLWAFDLAGALQGSFLVMLAAGAFVGIAFQPAYWYMFAIIQSLRQHVRRVEILEEEKARPPKLSFAPVVRPALAPAERVMS